MTNLVMLADHRKLHEYWQEYQRETGSNTDYQDWLEYLLLHRTELLKQAEERAAHHAEIASVCSATAERYGAALRQLRGIITAENVSGDISREWLKIFLEDALKEAE